MLWKHVSMFRLKDECRDQETVTKVADALKEMSDGIPGVVSVEIGVKPFSMPVQSPDGMVRFFDLHQELAFESEDACMEYPKMAGHREFIKFSGPYMDEVIGIDFPVDPSK